MWRNIEVIQNKQYNIMTGSQIIEKLDRFHGSELENERAAKVAGSNIASAVSEILGVPIELVSLGGIQHTRETAKSNLWLLPILIELQHYIIRFEVEFRSGPDSVKLLLRNGLAKIDSYRFWDSERLRALDKFAKDVVEEFGASLSEDQPNLYFIESKTTPFRVSRLPAPDTTTSVWSV